MSQLYIVSTPIGNLEDITLRAIKTLFSVDIIACEDTRVAGLLLSELKRRHPQLTITEREQAPRFISYYDEVEEKRLPELIEALEVDQSVALISDAGTPLISDPGFRLVRECLKRNISIESVPGPSSVITALTLSGLPADQFLFLGYLPTKAQKRKNLLEGLQSFNRSGQNILHPTVIFFEAGNRLQESLKEIKTVLGDIEIVIARELTKMHQEVWKGKVSDYPQDKETKGELVLLLKI